MGSYGFWVFLGSAVASVLVLAKTAAIVRFFGHISWAEEKLGGGGSYTVWKIIGVLLPILGLIYWLGLP